MKKAQLDDKIQELAKSLLSYCTTRTSTQFDAEDLAHDILLELYNSAENLRDENAFYAFMWAIASNVYKQWCKKKNGRQEAALTEDLAQFEEPLTEENDDVYLLRRELTLLSKKYREAVVLYYIENLSCPEIAHKLSISESMVKYLLFKSRKFLKEGIAMNRNYGTQSYNPKQLTLLFWGNGDNHYQHLCDNKISQNILFACYNNKLTAEQISLEIGVALPYMEEQLSDLLENDFIKLDGKRYYTNIVLLTEDLITEVHAKTAKLQAHIVDVLQQAVDEQEQDVRKIGFVGSDMPLSSYRWQTSAYLLRKAFVEILQNRIKPTYPKDKYGIERFVWGQEKTAVKEDWLSRFGFAISSVNNPEGDSVQFMDFPINGERIHRYFFNRQSATNVFLDIAKGKVQSFSQNDKALAADMVRMGYVVNEEDLLTVNAPIFTEMQFGQLSQIFSFTAEKLADAAEVLLATVTKIIKNHIPVPLKPFAKDVAYLHLFQDVISAPISILYENNFLLPYARNDLLPTTYVVLKHK